MSSLKERIGKTILPGEKIGVVEQFISGPGTYEEEGVIYASIVGELRFNQGDRVISVHADNRTAMPQVGDIVVGRVDNLKKQSVVVYINETRNFTPKGHFEASIHISNVSHGYIENISDAFRPYDLVRCRIIRAEHQPFQAVTDEKRLGAILSFCSICGEPLEFKGNRLVCPNCRNIEQRETAQDYGEMKL